VLPYLTVTLGQSFLHLFTVPYEVQCISIKNNSCLNVRVSPVRLYFITLKLHMHDYLAEVAITRPITATAIVFYFPPHVEHITQLLFLLGHNCHG